MNMKADLEQKRSSWIVRGLSFEVKTDKDGKSQIPFFIDCNPDDPS